MLALCWIYFCLRKMSKLYSKVVSSSEDETERIPLDRPAAGLVNWLAKYQVEEENVALEKAINLSKVRLL